MVMGVIYMVYPEGFKEKIKKFYKIDAEEKDENRKFANICIMKALNDGEEYVGKILREYAETGFPASDIVKAYEDKDFKDRLYQEVLRRLEAQKLYEEWKELFDAYRIGSVNRRKK